MNKNFKRILSVMVAAVIILGTTAVDPIKVMAISSEYNAEYSVGNIFTFTNNSEAVSINDLIPGNTTINMLLSGNSEANRQGMIILVDDVQRGELHSVDGNNISAKFTAQNPIYYIGASFEVENDMHICTLKFSSTKPENEDEYIAEYETGNKFTFKKNSETVSINDLIPGNATITMILSGNSEANQQGMKILVDNVQRGELHSVDGNNISSNFTLSKHIYYIGASFEVENGMHICTLKFSSTRPESNPDNNNNYSSSESTHSENPDKYPSELPGGSVISKGTTSCELKVHSVNAVTNANQTFLANSCAAKTSQAADIITTKNLDAYRALTLVENGSKQTVTWANIDTKYAGPVYAVVYNPTDKAYVISGTVNTSGTAKLNDFILRPSSTVTMFKLK